MENEGCFDSAVMWLVDMEETNGVHRM